MIGSEQAVREPVAAPVLQHEAPARATERDRFDVPAAPAFAACFALALISVLTLSWVPSSDPWAWLAWGQEIASHVVGTKIALGLAGGPSWKPFPAIFTSVFGLFGSAAPHLWLLVTRTAGLMALVAAFRLGKRFSGPVAGVIALIAVCLIQEAMFYFARGASEPIVAALTLWAIDRHLSDSPRTAYFLIFLATLNRPEFAPFLGLYALYLWLRVTEARTLAVVLLVLAPAAWLIPPWIISGNAFQAASAAAAGQGSPGSAIGELRSSPAVMTVPTLVLAAVGLAFAIIRRERTLQWLGYGAIAWALMVALMTQVSYGLPRYLLPAALVGCLLAAVAVVRIAELAGRGRPRAIGVAVGALIIAATLPWTVPRVSQQVQQARDADAAAYYWDRLFVAVDRVGGTRRVLPCRSSRVAINHTVASALAWKLKVPLRRIRPLMRGTGFVFSAPHTSFSGTTPPIVHASARTIRTIAVLPPWTVLEVTHRGASATPHCGRAGPTPA